jgi:hypothetical protein
MTLKGKDPVVVQDNLRENQIASHCGLVPTTNRSGPDAFDQNGNPFELKSGTKSGITTARDVGLHTIKEWRSKYWIIALGKNYATGFEMDSLYIAHPKDLELIFRIVRIFLLPARKRRSIQRLLSVVDT